MPRSGALRILRGLHRIQALARHALPDSERQPSLTIWLSLAATAVFRRTGLVPMGARATAGTTPRTQRMLEGAGLTRLHDVRTCSVLRFTCRSLSWLTGGHSWGFDAQPSVRA